MVVSDPLQSFEFSGRVTDQLRELPLVRQAAWAASNEPAAATRCGCAVFFPIVKSFRDSTRGGTLRVLQK